jgi:hypothetical protein
MTVVIRKGLGLDLRPLFMGGSKSWDQWSQTACWKWGINFPTVNTRPHLKMTKGIREQFVKILTTLIWVKERKESKSRVMAKLTPESSL